tara:strand:+ start:688 stop:1299 length:612 start_codon:yes stop_codon:yes gene_type:complete
MSFNRLFPRPHFILNIYIHDNVSQELKDKYREAADKHNNSIRDYLSGENPNVYFDAGFDLFTPEQHNIPPTKGTAYKIGQGVKCSMTRVADLLVRSGDGDMSMQHDKNGRPVSYYLWVRSSTGAKTPLRLANSAGIIDSGYRGEIISAFDNISDDNYNVEQFQRLVQICPPEISYPMLVKFVSCKEDLGCTERGEKGFGSSGK